jgi:hypothetical protein
LTARIAGAVGVETRLSGFLLVNKPVDTLKRVAAAAKAKSTDVRSHASLQG